MTGSLRSQAARGVMWTAIQTWAMRLTTTAAFIAISRQLQPSEFGLVALCMSVVGVLTLIGDVGMATYLVRKLNVDRTDTSTAFWTSLLIGGSLASVLCLLAPWISSLFDEPGMVPLLWTLAGGLVLSAAGSVPTALLKREMRFRALAVRTMTATVIGSGVAIALAVLGAGAWALVIQSVLRSFISAVLSFTASRWLPSGRWSRDSAKKMLSFGGQVMGIDLLNQVRDRGEDFILGSLAGTVTLGYWSVANRLVQVVRETGTSVVMAVATPSFSKLQHDRARLVRALETALFTSSAVMFPSMALLAVLSPDLVPMLLGQQWAVTAEAAQIVAISTALATMSWFDRTIFIAIDRLRPEIAMVSCFAVLHVVTILAFVHQSLTVLATVLLVKGIIIFPIRAAILHRYAAIPYRIYRSSGRVGAAAAIYLVVGQGTSVALSSQAPLTRVLVGLAVVLVVYPLALWLVARPVFRSLLSDLGRLRPRKPDAAPELSPTPVAAPGRSNPLSSTSAE